ncbi:hypothetical protein [Arsenicicoccus dermatophilus]|uniref:hypothetical protein n=1 Tax=Arsenicicoccus dermatophilus TaxID=1076331 RepID=UPI001F4D29D9|nr:hypothetical protein [Arsenicicoccus dermatophilus]MCH8613452.1 hypothetical protein [Arsenicicoccus dermatophilus]
MTNLADAERHMREAERITTIVDTWLTAQERLTDGQMRLQAMYCDLAQTHIMLADTIRAQVQAHADYDPAPEPAVGFKP